MEWIDNLRYKLVCLCNRWCICLHLRPYITKTDPVYELHISEKKQYIYCVISKNGCSSIMSSILKQDDGKCFDENVKIWDQKSYLTSVLNSHRIFFDHASEVDKTPFTGYRKFIVLRNPLDRFISFINNTYKEEEYNYLFDKSLPAKEYVDRVLQFYPYMISHQRADRRYDKHAIPQRVYYEEFHRLFGEELEVVNIKNLPIYYQELTGNPLIKNNVSKPQEKVCTQDTLTPEQLKQIETYIQQYEYGLDDEFTKILKVL